MKKKITLVFASLLASNCFASVGTTVHVDPVIRAAPNQAWHFFTNHAYAIQNDSGVTQNVTVCLTTTLCANVAAHNKKTIQSCDNFTISPGQLKNAAPTTRLDFNYPFTGSCDIDVSTEVFGWQHSVAIGKGRLTIG